MISSKRVPEANPSLKMNYADLSEANTKKVSMIKKYHNHTLLTSTWRHEKEPQNNYSHQDDKHSKVTSSLFLTKVRKEKEKQKKTRITGTNTEPPEPPQWE